VRAVSRWAVAAGGLLALAACSSAADDLEAGSATPADEGPPPVLAGGPEDLTTTTLGPVPGPGASSTSPPGPTGSPGSSTTTAPARDPELGSGEAVTFAFGGDVHFEKMIRTTLDRDPAAVFAPVSDLFGSADVAVVNLETAITTGGTPAPKDFTFRAPDTAFDALRAGNVDAVSQANNHGMDFGAVGLEDSLAAAEAKGFPVVGIGRDEDDAFRPWTTEVRGQRIAVIGATQVLDSNLITAWTATDTQPGLASAKDVDRLLEEVRAARQVADTVVVFLHWGTEKQTCPNERQTGLAPQLVEAGADIVVGSHAHRVLGGGRLGDAVVHYGLGNFVFYTSGGPGAESGVFLVTATGRRIDSYRWVPARIEGGLPHPLEGAEADQASASWEDLRACTGLAP
jgi:poly-gamma-glutamate capsule biosynthesis protein CapA/YwtB (metallophosphatase superfamily)